MELDYETNPGTNYIASKLSETAMKEIQAGVREEVTKTYAETKKIVLPDSTAELLRIRKNVPTPYGSFPTHPNQKHL